MDDLTWERIARMAKEEYERRRDEIHAWLLSHPVNRAIAPKFATSEPVDRDFHSVRHLFQQWQRIVDGEE
jgi:hypothetical protein